MGASQCACRDGLQPVDDSEGKRPVEPGELIENIGASQLGNPSIVLVNKEPEQRSLICVFEHFEKLKQKQHDVPLTLSSHPGFAVIAARDQAYADGPVSNVPLCIGDADSAIRVTFDGLCIWRTIDEKILCPYQGKYHEGSQLLIGSSRLHRQRKAVIINDNGTVSPVAAPHMVLGLEKRGRGVWGTWVSGKDTIQVLHSKENGIARSSDRFSAHVTSVSSGKVLVRYEWGESFLYTMSENRDLIRDDGLVAWRHIRPDSPEHRKPFFHRNTDKLRDLISNGCIRVLKGEYLESCRKSGKTYEIRHRIPESFFWDAEEALKLWDEHGRLFLLIWSYGWLSKTHPDPDGYHLRNFASILHKLRPYSAQHGVPDLGLVIDYCSLMQKDSETDARSDSQKKMFSEGLSGFTDLYVHGDVTAVKLMAMPESEPRRYDDRGWTLAESILIDSKPGVGNRLSFDNTFDPAFEDAEGWAFIHKHGHKNCQPPLTPDDFVTQLGERQERVTGKGLKLFASENDMSIVPDLYRSAFRCLQHSDVLNYPMSEWTDDEVYALCKTLKHLKDLKKLALNNNLIGNDGVRVLCETLLKNPKLTRLRLDYNIIGRKGSEFIMEFVQQHKELKSLSVNNNPFCKFAEVVDELKRVWDNAGKDIRLLTV